MNRLAHRLVDIAARRWPADLATDLSREWHAELAALETRSVRALTFAASLALSPAVEAAGEAPYGWRERA